MITPSFALNLPLHLITIIIKFYWFEYEVSFAMLLQLIQFYKFHLYILRLLVKIVKKIM